MNKTILVLLTFLLGGLNAKATDLQMMSLDRIVENQDYEMLLSHSDSIIDTASDKFQLLVDLAHQGVSVSFDQARGVYSGRCYDVVHRDRVFNAGLLVTEVPSKEGPLFPSEKLVIDGGNNGPADRFDAVTKEYLTNLLMTIKNQFSSLVENPLSVVIKGIGPSTISFFRNQGYLVSTYVANTDQDVNLRGTGKISVKKGDTWGACYYFIKK